jgi:outer membrane protein OmpA-like peptidoglycan-associated protein
LVGRRLKKKLSRLNFAGELARSRLVPVAGATSSLTAAGGSASTLASTGAAGTSTLSPVDTLKSELQATETDRGTLVSLAGDVTFDFNKATIRADARPKLDKLADLIKAQNAGSVAIEGHTDSKGNDAYNQRLSEARATAVRDYLISVRTVDGTKLTIKGVGELKPVAPNMAPDGKDDEAGRARNRRVEVVLGK